MMRDGRTGEVRVEERSWSFNHLLLKGTSCVDFSSLNNEKKTLEGSGQSGETFRGMLRYVVKHR